MTKSKHTIKAEDLSLPYPENGSWCVNEQLYPERRGFIQHKFDNEMMAESFIVRAKTANDNKQTLHPPKKQHHYSTRAMIEDNLHETRAVMFWKNFFISMFIVFAVVVVFGALT